MDTIKEILDVLMGVNTWKKAGIISILIFITTLGGVVGVVLYILLQDRTLYYEYLVSKSQPVSRNNIEELYSLKSLLNENPEIDDVSIVLKNVQSLSIYSTHASTIDIETLECYTELPVTVCLIATSQKIGNIKVTWKSDSNPTVEEKKMLYTNLKYIVLGINE